METKQRGKNSIPIRPDLVWPEIISTMYGIVVYGSPIIHIVDRHDSRDRFRVLAKPHPTTVVPSLLPNHRITSHQEKKQKTKNRSSIKKKKTVPRTLARETRERRKRNGRNVTVCPYCLCCKGAQNDEREPEEPADAAGVGVRVDRVIRGSRGGRKRWSRAR